ncbi:MAG: hypothetical protein P1Q69_08235 [Candidatus Thorarchaeota archaeon]|nr:hypothetical protein [Candidatus Thorarchaeota archaeon]
MNTWTVNAEFRFSQLWCLGVDSITTDIPHLLGAIDYPFWSMPVDSYLALWIVYAVSAIIIIGYSLRRHRP